jgi:hypothetical protein
MPETYYVGHEPETYKIYKTIGGWVVKYLDERNNISDAPGQSLYTHRQNAYRRAKQLNDALKIKEEPSDRKEWVYNIVSRSEITAIDLRDEIKQYDGKIQAFRIIITGHAEFAQGLYLPDIQRMGIAWSADATWADVDGLEQGIEMWANNPDEWNRRN